MTEAKDESEPFMHKHQFFPQKKFILATENFLLPITKYKITEIKSRRDLYQLVG